MAQSMINSEEAALAVKEKHELSLMAIPGVTGVGISEGSSGNFSIKVYVESMTPKLKMRIQPSLDGIKVEIEEIGEISAF